MSDLSFVQNLFEGDEIEMVLGDVLAASNPSQEMDTWKGKAEITDLKCLDL